MARKKNAPTKNLTRWAPKPRPSARAAMPLVKPGQRSVRNPNRYVKKIDTVISKSCFGHLCKSIIKELFPGLLLATDATLALHVASEEKLVGIFADANLCASHANRLTVTPKDIQLALRLRP